MSRLPIRIRLTLVFALAMAIVLAAVGAFVYIRLGTALEEQLDESLEARAVTLADAVRRGELPRPLPAGEEEVAQVLGPDGRVLAATPGLGDKPLRSDGDTRVLTRRAEGGLLIAVGGSLEDRDEALAGLLTQLLLGGPVALLLAAAAGYLLAGAALRPVEAMRRRAGEISADTSGRRLPLPAARDEVFRLGETLNAMLDRLDAGLRRERRFVADASHELRTPLAILRTELELALRRPRSEPELAHALRSAAEEVERLTRLAEDLLVLASSEDGRLVLDESEFQLRELLDGVARRFAARASLEVESPERAVTADRLRLEQALGNLVENALRHGAGSVRLEAAAENGSLVLRVSDHGPGFPQDFLPRAFERFSRADEARSRGGAGLGLAIVDAVAGAHGGTATASNDGGAVVALVLPAWRLSAY
jgi:two-component system OmpR family sensor kinase